MQTLLSVEQLSACLHKSVASIRSDASRNPESLPPICRLPGTKRLLWRAEDVDNWLAQHVLSPAAKEQLQPEASPRRRGRPRKTELTQTETAQVTKQNRARGRPGMGRA